MKKTMRYPVAGMTMEVARKCGYVPRKKQSPWWKNLWNRFRYRIWLRVPLRLGIEFPSGQKTQGIVTTEVVKQSTISSLLDTARNFHPDLQKVLPERK